MRRFCSGAGHNVHKETQKLVQLTCDQITRAVLHNSVPLSIWCTTEPLFCELTGDWVHKVHKMEYLKTTVGTEHVLQTGALHLPSKPLQSDFHCTEGIRMLRDVYFFIDITFVMWLSFPPVRKKWFIWLVVHKIGVCKLEVLLYVHSNSHCSISPFLHSLLFAIWVHLHTWIFVHKHWRIHVLWANTWIHRKTSVSFQEQEYFTHPIREEKNVMWIRQLIILRG